MALFRYCVLAVIHLFACTHLQAQTVYYPAGASHLLQSTAADVAMLLQKATGVNVPVQTYTQLPQNGIILQYDTSISGNQTCRVTSNGTSYIRFAAAQDNGLLYGIYQYLHQLGYRFYQPGELWEVVPVIASFYTKTDTLYAGRYRYKNWFISGGYNKWMMDNNPAFDWDMYPGDNGHAWALYMRRNCMLGQQRFAGHRDDIMTGKYMDALKANPCYVAPYNGSRVPTGQSVADVNNKSAMQGWAEAIYQQYNQYSNTILANKNIYPDIYNNFNYANQSVGLEVPDGAHWANTATGDGCSNNTALLTESDQHFTLAGYTAGVIGKQYPNKRFQVYAYDTHADVPGVATPIHPALDIQVVPTAFQNLTSARGLLSRWYSRSKNLSEYHYLNLPQWSGETPSFYLNDLVATAERISGQQAQGIVLEASPAKFASLPFLAALNNRLVYGTGVEQEVQQFCQQLFGNASTAVHQLLRWWADDKTVMLNNGIQDNLYKLPLYAALIYKASQQATAEPMLVQQRLAELKMYLHYMLLYYQWISDQRPAEAKASKAIALCNYLARIHTYKIVNSYFLITDVVNKYPETHAVYTAYNTSNGTAYNNLLPPVDLQEANQQFAADYLALKQYSGNFNLLDAATIQQEFTKNQLVPLDTIAVKVNYTYAKDYASRTEFFILAPAAGSFTVQYSPHFEIAGKGYINFTVEDASQPLLVLKDLSIGHQNTAGSFTVQLPAGGIYKFSMVSRHKSAADLNIITGGNFFYKNGPYLGNTIENYRGNLASLPGYFYVPAAIQKLYFSINNSNPGGKGFATAAQISQAFLFINDKGQAVQPVLANLTDSAYFYLDVPDENSGRFWRVNKMEQYRLCFANSSNIQWYARQKSCDTFSFTSSVYTQRQAAV
jgi:hypothetical protein